MSTSIFKRFHVQVSNRPYSWIVSELERGHMIDDPSYQRGHVWGEQRQMNLIKTVLLGLPTGGAILINERSDLGPFVIVDGKQRARAMTNWMNGVLRVPSSWFATPGGDEWQRLLGTHDQSTVSFDELTPAGRRLFDNMATVAVYMTKLTEDPEEQEREIFDLFNFGGIPQGETD